MVEKENEVFEDPLVDVDPIMKEAYSSTDVEAPLPDFPDDVEQTDHSHLYGTPNKGFNHSRENDAQKVEISNVEFPEISSSHQGQKIETGLFRNIPVQVSVELGRSMISLREIFELTEGSIIELDRLVGEPLDLVVNGQIVAQGEVVAIDNNFGLRIKSILSQPKA